MPVESIRQRKRRTVKYVLAGTAAGMVLFALLLVLWALTRPGLAFNEHDRLLVADVDNQTGDEVFDLALKTAIEADLQQSPYARVFDKGQVAETLRLMKLNPLNPSSRIDEQLGYDICRFAGIRALILPRILAAGEAYELHAIIIDPARERHVDRIRVRAQSREEVLLKAIDSLSSRLRSQLGESLASIQEADKTIAQVTTSSWEALQYLSLGLEKWHEAKYKDSAVFLELALDKDPHFASARSTLGLLLIQWLDQKEKGKEMLNQALADAEDISQKELLLIKAVHREFVEEDFAGALAEYRLITELFPDTMQAYNNSGMILRSLGRVDEAVVMYEKAAVVAPRNTVPLSNLYWTHLFFRKDPQAAEDAARRAVNLGPETALLQHMLGYTLAAQARFEEAAAAYKKCLEIEPRHPYGLPNLAYILLAMGRAGEAVPLYKDVHKLIREDRMRGYLPLASFDLAYALLQAGDPAAAREAAVEGLKDLEAKTENVSRQAWVPLRRPWRR
jgi:Flp pilus assembly protein TadD